MDICLIICTENAQILDTSSLCGQNTLAICIKDVFIKFVLKILPPETDLETTSVLKKAASAHRYLAELKGVSATIPNQTILINTLSLQEAKDSSAIENIITTHDDLFREEVFPEYAVSAAAKEVSSYVSVLKKGYLLVKSSGLLTSNQIIDIQAEMEKTRSGFRKLTRKSRNIRVK